MTSDTYGRMSPKRFARFDPDASCWRTWPDISLWDSMSSPPTWPKWGTSSGGDAYELPTPAHLTDANASSSLLPTPAAQEPGGTIEQYRARFKDGGASTFVPLGMIGDLLPTPAARDGGHSRGADAARYRGPKSMGGRRVNLDDAVEAVRVKAPWLLPTPTVSDSVGGRNRTSGRTNPNSKHHDGVTLTDWIWLQRGESSAPPSDAGNTSPDQHPHQLTIEDA